MGEQVENFLLLLKGRRSSHSSGALKTVSIRPGDHRSFRLFLAASVDLSLAAACIENGLHPVFLMSLVLVTAALLRADYAHPFFWSERIFAVLLFPYVAASIFAIIRLEGMLTLPSFLAYFTFGIIMVRVLAPLTDRNISQLIFLSAGLVVLNCILTNHILFGIGLPFYLFSLMGVLLLFHLARTACPSGSLRSSIPGKKALASWYPHLAKYVLVIMGGAAVLFILLPRPFAVVPGLRGPSPMGSIIDPARRISYRDMARMGGLYRIAFVASFETGAPPVSPYWRGRVLDSFDGESWSSSGSFRPGLRLPARTSGKIVQYRLLPYRLHSTNLYACGLPVKALGRWQQPLRLNDRGEILIDSPFLVSDAYEVFVALAPIPASRGPQSIYADTKGVTAAIKNLALQWTEGASTRRDKATALLTRLRRDFTYRLLVEPPPPDVHPLERFLLQTRVGNCEHFAGAMALMLRAVGVPSRVVEGFHGMETTADRKEFTIRFSHAHAWVEGLLEDQEWTTLEPTPAAAMEPPNVAWIWLTDLYDSLVYHWIKGVVNYDRSDQLMLLGGLAELLHGKISLPTNLVPHIGRVALLVVAGMIILLTIILLGRRLRTRRMGPSVLYVRTMKAMLNKGLLDSIHPWHEQNASRIMKKAPHLGEALTIFMHTYLEIRFRGEQPASRRDLQNARRRLLKEAALFRPNLPSSQ